MLFISFSLFLHLGTCDVARSEFQYTYIIVYALHCEHTNKFSTLGILLYNQPLHSIASNRITIQFGFLDFGF